MYQWRKFEFFEEKIAGKLNKISPPSSSEEENSAAVKIECCSSGRGKVVIGYDDGTISLLDRGLNFNFSFHAHSSSVLFLQHLKVTFNFESISTPYFLHHRTTLNFDLFSSATELSSDDRRRWTNFAATILNVSQGFRSRQNASARGHKHEHKLRHSRLYWNLTYFH